MCRIYGYLGSTADATMLEAAGDAQLSGGPDQQRHVTGTEWGLGCNRLAIQGPASGTQPFGNAARTVHAVFNGEIYNFRAVRAELARHGVRVDGDSDGSVIVPYYEMYGDRFTERLEGMFAIAIMDLRGPRRLKLWCDPLAVKSLYYAPTGDGLVFASELTGLTALRKAPPDLDPTAIDEYFNWQCLPNGTSPYTGVSALRPGERLVADGSTVVVHGDAGQHHPRDAYERTPAGLRELLTHEVTAMSGQPAKIALQLSGGLDSSILATMLRERRSDVTAFHVSHEGRFSWAEHEYARDAAERAGITMETAEIREADVPELLPAVVAALGAPNATPHALSAYVLFREISAAGFRVCFTGDGADEQFGGYRRYSTALGATGDDWAERYLDRLSLVPETEYRALYTEGYRAHVDSRGSSRRRARELLAAPSERGRVERILEFDRIHKLPGLNLRKLDHLSMAHAVEARVPYCQPAVTRFARTTPDMWKVDGPHRKRILWDAGHDLIPPSVRQRDKQPFTFPVAEYLTPGRPLWTYAHDVLARPRLCTSGLLDERAVRTVLAEHATGRDHARLIWGLLVLELSLP